MLLSNKCFIVYEFCKGPPPASLGNTDLCFLQELTEYLWENKLTNLIRLEIYHRGQPVGMVEFEMNSGSTVLLSKSEAMYRSLDQATR
jgi:hypothetical protein